MKNRIITLAIALCLIIPAGAFAENTDANTTESLGKRWAKGTLYAKTSADLFSPIGGQLAPFELDVGDEVADGAPLMTLRPLEVRAANDGIVRSMQSSVGDQAADVIAQYGALCYIEREGVHRVNATPANAYDKPENRAIHIGEVLRIYNGKESDPKETSGTVIAIDGRDFTIEIESGLYDLEDDVRIYRGTGDSYKAVDRVGTGKIALPKPVATMADGVIASIFAEEGKSVRRGDVLFYLDAANATHRESASVSVAANPGGMIEKLLVQPGQFVQKGQLLLSIQPIDALELKVKVDELDIPSLKPGLMLQVRVDALPGQTYTATLERVSPLPITVLDATKYEATLSLREMDSVLLPGMHATAYWD